MRLAAMRTLFSIAFWFVFFIVIIPLVNKIYCRFISDKTSLKPVLDYRVKHFFSLFFTRSVFWAEKDTNYTNKERRICVIRVIRGQYLLC